MLNRLAGAIFLLVLFSQNVMCGNIWEDVKNNVDNSFVRATFFEIKEYISLLAEKKSVKQEGDALIIGEHIRITEARIQSFRDKKFTDLEFEMDLPLYENGGGTMETGSLDGIRIQLDYLETHRYFNDVMIGGLSYKQFGKQLRDTLARHLRDVEIEVTFLRPENVLDASSINKNPPHVVISLQYNNNKQDCMTTFCDGNVLIKEFENENMRARFVEAALTRKNWNSADLGACVTTCCCEDLGVAPLSPKDATFEGNAQPVSTDAYLDRGLEVTEGSYNGVATRNMAVNGIFAHAVIIPFPDMKWVRQEADAHGVDIFIEKYAASIKRAVLMHTGAYRSNYNRNNF